MLNQIKKIASNIVAITLVFSLSACVVVPTPYGSQAAVPATPVVVQPTPQVVYDATPAIIGAGILGIALGGLFGHGHWGGGGHYRH